MSYRGSARGRGRGGGRGGPQLPKDLLSQVDPSGSQNRNRGRPRGTIKSTGGAQREDVKASLKQFNERRGTARPPPPDPKPIPKRAAPEPTLPPAKKKKKELTLPGAKVDDAEDGEIEWLEYMLRKEKAKDAMDDGLDDLLDFADLVGPGGSGLQQEADEEGVSEDVSQEDEDPDENDSTSEEDETESEEGSVSDAELPASIPPPKEETPTAIVEAGRYIPPHERAALLEAKSRGDKAKELKRVKLERRAQGVLNKLSEANMETMLAEIEGLYRDHSRHDVSTIMTDLIINTIANRDNLLDSYVILYATMVGALHRIIGLEFGARFVHAAISKYHTADGKSSLNLLTLIAELYNAQTIGANLIYDLIRSFLTESSEQVMSETQVESLLRLLRCSGQQLRSDDPASLKDIVNLVLEKTKGKEKTMTTRAKFMIETLVDLKGGKMRSTQNTDQDAANRMKSYLNGLSRKRRVATTEPLRASLQDLISADTRGKWWLVGAGWAGNPLMEKTTIKKPVKPAVEDEEVLLEAARSQGMNTDVRRSVFVILMTSEDYLHACDRLSLLKFTETQQREFVRVALHCAATEKSYNPYHALILNHLCSESYSHRFTLQYALWDFLRDLGDGKSAKRRCENVAKTAAYLIGRKSLDLTVFKAVEFTSLNSAGIHFFSTFLSCLLLATQTASPLFALKANHRLDDEAIEETFEKALTKYELAQGLALVMRRKGAIQGDLAKRAASVAMEVLSRAV